MSTEEPKKESEMPSERAEGTVTVDEKEKEVQPIAQEEGNSNRKSLKEEEATEKSSSETAVGVKEKPKPAPRPVPKKVEPKEEVVLEPSPLEPVLAQFKEEIEKCIGSDCIEEAYINRAGEHTPTLVIKREKWLDVATQLKENANLNFNYVRNLSAVDYSKHMEMTYVFFSFSHSHQIAIRVKLDREAPVISTVSHLWEAANWNERECYDLFGIVFENHPNLRRILLPDHWEGYPLRKDYEPLDKEV